jgi:hypothetical protein
MPTGATRNSSPAVDEIEISLFGPGVGECVVVHFGDGKWLVVDSCLNGISKRPSALDYFDQIGVNVAKDVPFLVSTHWHDDHIRGLSTLFGACESAVFVCGHALQCQQFLELTELYSKDLSAGGSGVQEFVEILAICKARKKLRKASPKRFVSAGTVLYQNLASPQILIKALSPSEAAFESSLMRFGRALTPKVGEPRGAVPNVSPNDLSIVLSLAIEDIRVLLGADLEEDDRIGFGWKTVIERFAATDSANHGFKVPHHGSVTAHNSDIWPLLMQTNAWALLTPFLRGRKQLPSAEDIERICSLSSSEYITARRASDTVTHPFL